MLKILSKILTGPKFSSCDKSCQHRQRLLRSAMDGHVAMRQMKSNGVSSVYMVDDDMRLRGLLTLDNVMQVRSGVLSIEEALIRDIPLTTPDVSLQDLMVVAAEAKYPIAVTDERNQLVGIVTKAAVLSSLVG